MSSQIGWIDFSTNDKNRITAFMAMLGQGVADELGVGTIRDGFSNRIFPGFSTLYTRAKYFFITPYILKLRTERQRKDNDYFGKEEISINRMIKKFFIEHPDLSSESYFGKNTEDGNLERQPSVIYWNGIRTLKLIDTTYSLAQFIIEKPSFQESQLSTEVEGDETFEEGEADYKDGINVETDKNWKQYIDEHGLELTDEEARYLCQNIQRYTPGSIMAELIKSPDLWENYQESRQKAADTCRPLFVNGFTYFVNNYYKNIQNQDLRSTMIRAHDFAYFVLGPHIVYNLQLAIRSKAPEGYINDLKTKCKDWYASLSNSIIDYQGFDMDQCFVGVNVPPFTKAFLKEAWKLTHERTEWEEIEERMRELVELQEKNNKKTKSRFKKLDQSGEAIPEVMNGEWIGYKLIPYRYDATLSVMRDILNR